jgi:predicted outer membrane protein
MAYQADIDAGKIADSKAMNPQVKKFACRWSQATRA